MFWMAHIKRGAPVIVIELWLLWQGPPGQGRRRLRTPASVLPSLSSVGWGGRPVHQLQLA